MAKTKREKRKAKVAARAARRAQRRADESRAVACLGEGGCGCGANRGRFEPEKRVTASGKLAEIILDSMTPEHAAAHGIDIDDEALAAFAASGKPRPMDMEHGCDIYDAAKGLPLDDGCETCAAMRRGDTDTVLHRMFSAPSIEVGGLWADEVRRTMTPEQARAAGITFSDEMDDA